MELHGSVSHLLAEDGWVYAVTDLGQFWAWNLSDFKLTHCELMNEVWDQVGVLWSRGQAIEQSLPTDHSCLRTRSKRSL